MKLSKNFYLDEFTLSAGIRIQATDEQIYCLKILTNNILQPIRNRFGPVVINSGLRNMESYKKLLKEGYNASSTSDHFAWSTVNPRGTGAADIYLPKSETKSVFYWININLYDQIGQVIYYPTENFIHVSNKFSDIFTMADEREEVTRSLIYFNGEYSKYNGQKGKKFKLSKII